MKVMIASLFVLIMMFSFTVAEGSSIPVDFYVQEPGMTGGYEEDVADTSSRQIEWLSNVIYWGAIVIAFAILIKILKMVGGKKSKKKSRRKK